MPRGTRAGGHALHLQTPPPVERSASSRFSVQPAFLNRCAGRLLVSAPRNSHAGSVRSVVVFLLALASLSIVRAAVPAAAPADSAAADTVNRLFAEALSRGEAYERLREFVASYPGRLAGSPALAGAIDWAEQTLRTLPLDRVRRQDVMVPHWERGAHDRVAMLAAGGEVTPLASVALGGSGASPEGGIAAEVVEVRSIDELATLGRERIEGRIVFFNRPVDAIAFPPNIGYRGAADQRNRGPAAAAGFGAVGALTRSLTLARDEVPHAGYTGFPAGTPPIPAAAISTLAADRLSAALASDPHVRAQLDIQARWFPDAPSHNVIGEIRGAEFPDEVIVVGAHLDSWDNTPGAHDDGAGVVQAIEVLRLFRTLDLRPRHTVRCVLFTNEENGLRGANAYAAAVKKSGERHLFAIESDTGGFAPVGFSIAGRDGDTPHLRMARWRPLFERWGIWNFRAGSGGGDVMPLRPLGAVVVDLAPDSQRYLDLHHAATDTFETVHPRELHLGAAALAAIVWLVDSEGL